MNKVFKRMLAKIVLFSSLFTTACGNKPSPSGGGDDDIPVVLENSVIELYIVYNGQKVTSGFIELDMSQKTANVSCSIKTVGSPKYTLSYTIDDTSVAEITQDGLITIKKVGETVLTAGAGGLSHSVVLIVGDKYAPQPAVYTITVEGGTANVSSMKAGGYVQLKADTDLFKATHKEFVGWQYFNKDTMEPLTDLWINGSVFRMPECNVLVKALTKAKLYKLNLVDAKIKSCVVEDENVTPEFVEGSDGLKTYSLPYNADVVVEANEESEGKMFVGFDVGSRNNRKGTLGETTYSLKMPDETYTIFAKFADTRDIKFGAVSALGVSGTSFENGNVDGAVDEDLQGFSGYSFNFSSSASVNKTELPGGNFTGCVDFSTLKRGSQTIRAIFKNHSDQSFGVEMFAEQYSTGALSGLVKIPAHGIVVRNFIASSGFHNPNFGLVLREKCSGGSNTKVKLDVAFATADTYPDGDPQFVVPEAQYVVLRQLSTGSDFPAGSGIRGDCFESGPEVASSPGQPITGSFGGRKNTNNLNGITNMLLRDDWIKYSSTASQYPYIYSYADNVPSYKDNKSVTVYFRVNNTSNNEGKFIFALGNSTSVNSDTTRVKAEITLQPQQVSIFGITYERTSETDELIISLTRPSRGTKTDFNIIVQMMYNNKIGCLDENIYKA